MADQPRWGVGPDRYKQRQNKQLPHRPDSEPDAQRADTTTGLAAALGFRWDRSGVEWDALPAMPVERALARFRGQLAEHVWDAAALEGNPFTLPEVQTLLDGVTVGGHRLSEEQQVLALAESTRLTHRLVEQEQFSLDKQVSDRLHGLVAPHEAIEAGHFRGEGSVTGGGHVNLGEFGRFSATGSDDGGQALLAEYATGVAALTAVEHPVERAVAYFCFGTRHQFYFDGNKRTSRLMMNGELMSNGFDAISIPFARRLEFNQHLIELYRDADATGLMRFIVGCRPQP